MAGLVSPDEMLAEAKKQMLDGKDPVTETDWAKVMNFVAFNLRSDVALPACLIMRALYDIPLDKEHIEAIVEFQILAKENDR